MGSTGSEKAIFTSDPVVCIGDIHGNLLELQALWGKLEERMGGARRLGELHVVFLGDYCDRGPETRSTLDWLIDLKARRPRGLTHFIAGNHDFAMASYLGLTGIPDGCARAAVCGGDAPGEGGPARGRCHKLLETTRSPAFTSGFWPFDVPCVSEVCGAQVDVGMHYQGRRWGSLSVYSNEATLRSYGVDQQPTRSVQEQFAAAVPDEHKRFLRELDWVVEVTQEFRDERAAGSSTRRLYCIHAGVLPDRGLGPQLCALRRRDFFDAVLIEDVDRDPGRVAALCTRLEVQGPHPELEGTSDVIVSGHHGLVQVGRNRVVVDSGGGRPGLPIQAVVFDTRSHEGGGYQVVG